MKKTGRLIMIVIAVSLITGSLIACSSGEVGTSESMSAAANLETTEAVAEGEKVQSETGTAVDSEVAAQETDPPRDEKEHEEMLEVNNVRLSVKEAGSGPDMILIHGRTLSKEAMHPLFNYYKDWYHVVSYDVRGHGKTESSGEFTLDDLSDDLVELIHAYHLEKPVVIGFSMGSYITLKTAERYPDLFSRMVLIGTRGGRTSSPWPATDEIGRALESYDNMTDASKATVPALVLTGENDVINPPEEGKKVADALPDAAFEIVPGAEHMAFGNNPDFVFSRIDEFLG